MFGPDYVRKMFPKAQGDIFKFCPKPKHVEFTETNQFIVPALYLIWLRFNFVNLKRTYLAVIGLISIS